MKVAPNVILFFQDSDGFGTAISAALQPNPNSNLHILEESFELSLERYGIRDRKASGTLFHFLNPEGLYEVSIMLLVNYESPLLPCALNEVLASFTRDKSSTIPTIIVPFIIAAAKLKLDHRSSSANGNASLYGFQLGPRTEIMDSLSSKLRDPPPTLQVDHESLACLLQLLRVLGLPSYVIIGQTDRQLSHDTCNEELQIMYEVGDILGSLSSVCFERKKMVWKGGGKCSIGSKEEAWRALYG